MRDGVFNDWTRGLGRILLTRFVDVTGTVVALAVVASMLGFGRARIREVWDSSAGSRPSSGALLEQESDGTFINQLAFSPEGNHLAVSTVSGFVSVRDLATGRTQTLQRGPVGSIRQVLFSPAGRNLIFVGRDSMVRSWDWESGVVADRLELDTDAIRCVALSPDGGRMAAGATVGHFVSWVRRNAGSRPQARLGLLGPVNQVVFSPDGLRLAAGDSVGTLVLWDLASGRTLASVRAASVPLRVVVYSPDGSRLLTLADQERVVRIWDATTGASRGTFPAAPVPLNAIACSVDGSMVAVARSDGMAGLLDADTGRALGAIRVGRHLSTVAFSPDGRILATGGADGVARLWDLTHILGSSRPDTPPGLPGDAHPSARPPAGAAVEARRSTDPRSASIAAPTTTPHRSPVE